MSAAVAKRAVPKKAVTKKQAVKATKKIAKAAAKKGVAKQASAPRKAAAVTAGGAGAAARIDRMIASLEDWRGDCLAGIRKLIHEADPQVVEEWKWMGTPVWSHQGMYVLANAHKDKVKLTFFHGAKLQDPGGLFNAGLGGGKWRAIDIREGERIDRPKLKALLREAIDYNLSHRVPKSRGSRA